MRRWADAGLAGLVAARAEIDGLNVYPIPDADTGSNLVRTLQAGVEALLADGSEALSAVSETLATAVLRGACGNSGTIVSQLLRGLADAARGIDVLDGPAFAAALTRSAALARAALARPVEGTILSVADAAAAAATRSAGSGEDLLVVVAAARLAGEAALAATPGQLAALQGRVDAGGRGLVVLLAALETAVSGVAVEQPSLAGLPTLGGWGEAGADPRPADPLAHSHEVMYLLQTTPGEGEQDRVDELRTLSTASATPSSSSGATACGRSTPTSTTLVPPSRWAFPRAARTGSGSPASPTAVRATAGSTGDQRPAGSVWSRRSRAPAWPSSSPEPAPGWSTRCTWRPGWRPRRPTSAPIWSPYCPARRTHSRPLRLSPPRISGCGSFGPVRRSRSSLLLLCMSPTETRPATCSRCPPPQLPAGTGWSRSPRAKG